MADEVPIVERGVLSMSAGAWEEARRRAGVIGPLASGPLSQRAADAAGEQLGLSRRQVFALVKRWRDGSGLVTDVAVGQSDGGRGARRLPEPVEVVIREVLDKRYMTRQRPTLAAVYGDVVRACKAQGLRVPARNTVASRIALLHPAAVAQAREGSEGARGLRGAGGSPPAIEALLEEVQVDHTVIDVIVVDERDRLPIGRPYLTVGDRRVQPVPGRHGRHAGGPVGGVGRAVPGACVLRQAAVAGRAGAWRSTGR